MADAERILAWRNAPHIRAVMFTSGEIDMEGHLAWLRRTIARADAHAFIYEQARAPVGYVKLDDDGGGLWRWGFYIGAAEAPAGSGSRMLYLALDMAFETHGATRMQAEVRPGNAASLRLHEKLGFERIAAPESGTGGEAVTFELAGDAWLRRRIALSQALFAASGTNGT